jgi:2-keto-4-pentenoate hydratase/2-oxohepta-3-ene-1,7-dioic acid hydratase in catechol pathway
LVKTLNCFCLFRIERMLKDLKLLTFNKSGGYSLGIKTEEGIVDVAAALERFHSSKALPNTIHEAINGGSETLLNLQAYLDEIPIEILSECLFDESTIEFGPCVTHPKKIICVGTNYRKHAEESKMPIPSYPLLFNKFNNTIAASGEGIPIPFETEQADYEAELGIIIGKTAKRVSKEDALTYVFGYCNANDLSARDLQFRTHQWLLGKSCDKFSPVGPYLVTADEVGYPNSLRIRCIVNGEVRQDSNTSDMIFYCDELVSYISQYMTLEPGDLILTGTPEGVVFSGFDGKVCHKKSRLEWLKDGDEVTVEIEKLGALTSRMFSEPR